MQQKGSQKMALINRICVFCGAARGNDPIVPQTMIQLGGIIGGRRKKIVFGGGLTGLMYDTARACHLAGGNVVAVIPEDVKKKAGTFDLPHKEIVVNHMHPRKREMYKNSDAFVLGPGADGS